MTEKRMTEREEKYERILKLAGKNAAKITESPENWAGFLTSAARMYKYPFTDQVLIHAQRPDAAACAPAELWKDTFGRWIKKGSKGIALMDGSKSDRKKLKYVFDISDTREGFAQNAEKPVRPYIWRMREEHAPSVLEALEAPRNRYGKHGDTVRERIENLLGYPDERQGKRKLVRATALFLILTRCGLDTSGVSVDFQGISECNGKALMELGTAASKTACKVLERIERAVKNHDREKARERKETGEHGSQSQRLETGIGHDGNSVGGHPGDGAGTDRADNLGSAETRSSYGDERPGEEDGTDELGWVHERPARDGGGDRDAGAELPPEPAASSLDVQSLETPHEPRPAGQNVLLPAEMVIPEVPEGIKEDQPRRLQLPLFSPGEEGRTSSSGQSDIPALERPEPSPDAAAPEEAPQLREARPRETESQPAPPGLDYRLPDEPREYGGPKTKFKANVEAIRTLKAIEAENRLATVDEQEVLSRYVGWGGISESFNEDKERWADEYAELEELLTEDEYNSARASTLNAHYTNPTVVKAIYKALDNMGFEGGRILEPAVGIGNFFGLMPEGMKEKSELRGVELDGISGRIARQLYQTADIQISGFEKTAFPDGYFDAAIGNVPFGGYKPADRKYNSRGFFIHDYFLSKSLDLVRPGGVAAIVTSKGTMDKENASIREYLAQRAELLGAVRLPNNAFEENAGTGVTADILFLRKRERTIEVNVNQMANPPEWIHIGRNQDGIRLNSYFLEHPEMILGRMEWGDVLYGRKDGSSCAPFEGRELSELLDAAIGGIEGKITARAAETETAKTGKPDWIPADPSVRNRSFTLVNGELYYREDSLMEKQKLTGDGAERLKGLMELAGQVRAVMESQRRDYPNEIIKRQQAELNETYGRFTGQFGLIHGKVNKELFDKDSSYPLLCGIEELDENGKLARKGDIFDNDKRVVRPHSPPQSVDTPADALAVSLAEKARVDLDYMAKLTGMEREKIIENLSGVIFANPQKKDNEGNYLYETADEYLSGRVRQKLEIAEMYARDEPGIFNVNVAALQDAQPPRLEAKDIDARLGAAWIDKKYVQEFMYELLDTPSYRRSFIEAEYSEHTGEWNITNKNSDFDNVKASVTYGTSRINAYGILENALNLKDVRVYDTVDEKRVLNRKETMLAQARQDTLKEAFRDWIFRDYDRREALVERYNALFNSTRPREYDGSHLVLPGINPGKPLKEHQTAAIARIMYGGNTLLAHEVGAGKTFVMAAAAMEMKRLKLCGKSLFVVPNHLTKQTQDEFMKLYPLANIIAATEKDFEKDNRKKFCARIATGDYDAVIIGYSQFEKIPLSPERRRRFIEDQIEEITEALGQTDRSKGRNGRNFTVKQLEKTKKNLEAKLEKLNDDSRKDNVVYFEELGVDRLFVDEAHYYKNLYLHTKMSNVAGISRTEAQKSSDMQAKCQYMDELTGNKGVIFATGTPVSNSMTEIFTMMRYLQRDKLMEMNLRHFDAWASTFGEVTASVELAPEGTGYKARTRFKFNNMPELMRVFKEAADIKTADTLNLERPEAVFENIAVEPSEIQKTLVEKLSERAEAISKGSVDSSEDNMLCVTSDGRKIGLDPRLIDPMYPDEPGSKVNACVNNIHRIWDETKEKRLTQLVFCDFSTPNKDKFNVYDDIRSKLIAKGVLEKEIAYIHDADTQQKKDDLFKKAQSGSVRILMGSTQKMGAGTNVQNRLIAIHDVDCPWRPADLEQRAGRIIRQGNTNERVYVYRYSTKATFDAYLWQTLENKQKLISQVMTSKTPARRCDDVDESVLSYAEVKALCAGNPLIREKMELDVRVTKLKTAKAAHQSNIYELQEKLRNHFPVWIRRAETLIGSLKSDKERAAASEGDKFPGMTLMGKAYDAKEEAAKVLAALCAAAANAPLALGSYRGFEMSVKAEEKSGKKVTEITLKGSASHSVILGESESGSIVRLNNGLNGIAERIARHEEQLGVLRRQAEAAREEIERPFPMEAELKQKTTRLNELNLTLDLGEGNTAPAGPDTVTPEESLSPAPEPSLSLEPGGAAISASDKAASERKRLTESAKRKGVVILTDAQKNRAYSGGVLEAGDVYAVQKISRGMGIIHSFIKAPELRDAIAARGNGKLCIRYGRNGKCSITAIENGQDKETTLGH